MNTSKETLDLLRTLTKQSIVTNGIVTSSVGSIGAPQLMLKLLLDGGVLKGAPTIIHMDSFNSTVMSIRIVHEEHEFNFVSSTKDVDNSKGYAYLEDYLENIQLLSITIDSTLVKSVVPKAKDLKVKTVEIRKLNMMVLSDSIQVNLKGAYADLMQYAREFRVQPMYNANALGSSTQYSGNYKPMDYTLIRFK